MPRRPTEPRKSIPVAGDEPFPLNSRASHTEGSGDTVTRCEGDEMPVLVDTISGNSFTVPVVLERGLLAAAD